ncbi:MAG: tetratricopeptide repeat protein, partial [Gammaproteobacteria bacterium AqS3]|nr:tetratricopeptide repeat protein [Gammaproteobacteria bacterium AqS3]
MAERRVDRRGSDGGGSAALAASPAPWEIEYSPDERRAGVDTELKDSEREYKLSKDALAAYENLGNLRATLSNNEEIKFWRAWYASEAGLLDEAETIYEDLILRNPENVWSYNALGYLLAKNDYERLAKAVELLERAVEISEEPATIHSLGYALHKSGDLEAAEVHYIKAVELLTANQELSADDETAQEIFGSYGRILLSLPDRDSNFERLLTYLRNKRQDDPWRSAYNEVLFLQAFYKNRPSEEIVEHFSKLSENSSNSSRPVIIYALMLQRMGDQQDATILLNRAGNYIDEESSNDALDFYAFALNEVGMMAEAEDVLRTLITREPNNPWFYGRLGYLLAKEGVDIEEALEHLQKALELAPGRPEFQSFYAWALHESG